MQMPGENRPDLRNATKVTNMGLDGWLATYTSPLNRSNFTGRIIDANENMEEGEACNFYAVAPFGRSIRCLVVRRKG